MKIEVLVGIINPRMKIITKIMLKNVETKYLFFKSGINHSPINSVARK